MKVHVNGKEIPVEEAPRAKTVGGVLRTLGLSPEAHVVLRDGLPLTEDETVRPDDSLEIVRAISGGAR